MVFRAVIGCLPRATNTQRLRCVSIDGCPARSSRALGSHPAAARSRGVAALSPA
jgi:hypothetical protein